MSRDIADSAVPVTAESPTRDEQVCAALNQVYDPCSLALNNPLSIVDMGLVRQWLLHEDGSIEIEMCLTGPGCMMFPTFVDAARQELCKIDFIDAVEIQVDPTVMWTEDFMTDRGRQLQEQRHRRTHRINPVRPQQWREQIADRQKD